MARFLPYDQTGFDRIDPKPAREAYGTGAKWLDPRLAHKPKDWSSPEGIQAALGLTKAIIDHPVTDMVARGIGEAFKGGKTVAPTSGQYDALMREASDARRKAEEASKMGGILKLKAEGGYSQEDLMRRFQGAEASEEDLRLFMGEFGQRSRVAMADQGRFFAEAERLEKEASNLSGGVIGSMDDLFAFVAREGATKDDLAFSLQNVSRFAPAQTLTQIRAGEDPSSKLRIQLRDTFLKGQRGYLTEQQEAMLRLREGNYRSMDQKRRDDALVKAARAEHYGRGIDAAIDLKLKRGEKLDADIDKIGSYVKNATNKTQLLAIRQLISSLGKGYRRKYPAVYRLLEKMFSEWGMTLTDPRDLYGAGYSPKKKTKKGVPGQPGEGTVAGDLNSYENRLNALKAKREAGNLSADQWIENKNAADSIASILRSVRTGSKVGKGQLRRDPTSKLFLFNPADKKQVERLLVLALNERDKAANQRKSKVSVGKATAEQRRLLGLAVSAAAGSFGLGRNPTIAFINGKFRLKNAGAIKKMKGIYNKDQDGWDEKVAFNEALAALNRHYAGHGNLIKYKKGN
jgi:hypothetical protein